MYACQYDLVSPRGAYSSSLASSVPSSYLESGYDEFEVSKIYSEYFRRNQLKFSQLERKFEKLMQS